MNHKEHKYWLVDSRDCKVIMSSNEHKAFVDKTSDLTVNGSEATYLILEQVCKVSLTKSAVIDMFSMGE